MMGVEREHRYVSAYLPPWRDDEGREMLLTMTPEEFQALRQTMDDLGSWMRGNDYAGMGR